MIVPPGWIWPPISPKRFIGRIGVSCVRAPTTHWVGCPSYCVWLLHLPALCIYSARSARYARRHCLPWALMVVVRYPSWHPHHFVISVRNSGCRHGLASGSSICLHCEYTRHDQPATHGGTVCHGR